MSTFDSLTPLFALRLGTIAVAFVLFAGVGKLIMAVRPLEAPNYGPNGKARTEAREYLWFRVLEPLTLGLGGALRPMLGARLRSQLASSLKFAGEPFGLCVEELLALSLIACGLCGALGAWLVPAAGMHRGYLVLLTVLGLILPAARVHAMARDRAHKLERSLPFAMDLCALCMGAGSDFPSALRSAVAQLGPAHVVCRDELSRVLDELALGVTRVVALRGLADRTTSAAVREFVAALCQAEEKGTPLVDTLSIQATCLRQRRSVRAEELAAQAGVKMMVPMLLLVVTLMLIIFGPFIVNGAGL